jgi:hypothetical protein
VADNGEPRQQRCSGGVWWSRKGNSVEMHLCERKKKSVGSSRTCLRPRRRCGRVGVGAGGRRESWRLGRRRRDVERQEQASSRPGRRRARRRRAHGTAQSGAGAVGSRHMVGEAVAVRRAEKQRRRSGCRRRRGYLQFPESVGTPL